MYVEAFLLAAARTRPNITVRFGWPVVSFQEDDTGVTVEAEPTTGGAREIWRAQYLAGCDGGRSFVRRSLALRYNGFASLDSPHYGGRQNATYFRAPTLYRDHLAHRPGWNYWVVNPKGRCTIISLNDPDEFLAFSKGSDDGAAPTDESMAGVVRRAVGADLPVSDHRPLAVDRGRRAGGRALHRRPRGAGRRRRAPVHADRRLRHEHRHGRRLQPRLEARRAGAGLGRREPAAILRDRAQADRRAQHHRGPRAEQAARQHAADRRDRGGLARGRSGAARSARIWPPWARNTPRSACSSARATTARRSSSATARRRPTTTCATRRPACRAAARRTTGPAPDAAPATRCSTGSARASRCCGSAARPPTRLRSRPRRRQRGVPLKVLDVPSADARDLYGADLALIRPDQYVAWRGNAPPADPERLISQVVGAI